MFFPSSEDTVILSHLDMTDVYMNIYACLVKKNGHGYLGWCNAKQGRLANLHKRVQVSLETPFNTFFCLI